jgi:hypothetical protein
MALIDKDEETYQLYKLLSFAIQELSIFASEERVEEILSLPHPIRVITNRARLAVEKIENQDPHFFSGYDRFKKKTSISDREDI